MTSTFAPNSGALIIWPQNMSLTVILRLLRWFSGITRYNCYNILIHSHVYPFSRRIAGLACTFMY